MLDAEEQLMAELWGHPAWTRWQIKRGVVDVKPHQPTLRLVAEAAQGM
jgi:hypothetical protein